MPIFWHSANKFLVKWCRYHRMIFWRCLAFLVAKPPQVINKPQQRKTIKDLLKPKWQIGAYPWLWLAIILKKTEKSHKAW